MKILSSEFHKGATEPKGLPRDFKDHIAFLGRSNVGKSSFLNTLVQKKHLARSSSRPGKTTEVNFFLINSKVYFVDLPGYGYAKQPNTLRKRILDMISWYVSDQQIPIKRFVLLIDSNVGFTDLDWEILEYMKQFHPAEKILIILNKVDKLSKSRKGMLLEQLARDAREYQCIPFSSMNGEGRDAVLAAL